MFDEYDEASPTSSLHDRCLTLHVQATALMPIEPIHRNTPQEIPFMALDADGEVLPDDWYLWVTSRFRPVLR